MKIFMGARFIGVILRVIIKPIENSNILETDGNMIFKYSHIKRTCIKDRLEMPEITHHLFLAYLLCTFLRWGNQSIWDGYYFY